MADAKATLAISLEDKASAPADNAADSIEALRDRIVASQNAMRDMSAAMGRLKGPSAEVIAQKKLLADRLTAERTKLAENQAGYLKLGGALGEIGKKSAAARVSLTSLAKGGEDADGKSRGLTSSLERLGVPLGSLGEKGSALTNILGGSSGLGIALGAVAIGAAVVAAALAALVVSVVAVAVKMADGARSTRIYLQALGGGVAGGAALGKSIGDVAKKVSLAREELQGIASDLFMAGLKGNDLTAALESVAMVQATIGAGPAGKLKSALEAASKTGSVVVKDLEAIGLQGKYTFEELRKAVNDRFGAAAEAQLISLPGLMNRIKAAGAGMFAGLNVEPVLKVLDSIVKLFEESSVSGKALRVVVSSLLQPLFDTIGKNGKVFTAFFKGGIIAALLFTLAVLKIKNAFKEAFGGGALDGISAIKVAMYAGALAAGLFLMSLVVLGTWIALLGAIAAMPVFAIIGLVTAFKDGYKAITGLDWAGIGKSIVDGIVNGITAGAGKVLDTISNLGKDALRIGKLSIESKSPSKAFAREFGKPIAQGAAVGVEDATPELEGAVVSMGRAAIDVGTGTLDGAKGSTRAAQGGGASVNVVNNFTMHGVTNVASFEHKVRPVLVNLFRELSRGGLAPA